VLSGRRRPAYTGGVSAISFDTEPPVWPSKSHGIRGGGADWTQNACLGWSRGTWYARVHGFRVAAELLANHVAQTRTEQDGLIFPFLYNWRQHIELALKELIIVGERLLGRDGKRPEGHNLDGLWQRCRKALEAVEPKAEARSLDHAGRLIGELHAMDPKGDAFRDPRTRQGDATLDGIEHLSFSEINEALQALSNFLEAAGMAITADLEILDEMEAEFRQEMEAEFGPEMSDYADW
jgi:hypothetical protein